MTGQDGLAAWATVAATALAVVVVAGGAFAVTQSGHDSTSPGAEPGTTPTVTVSSPSQSSPTASSPSTSDPGGQPVRWPAACTKAAKQAIAAGLGVMGPAELPHGWTVSDCAFAADTWTVHVASPQGPIALHQQKGTEAQAVAAQLSGFTKGATVHAQGTGAWHSWTDAQGAALSKGLASTAVVLTGSQSPSYLTDYASSLLTYETAPGGPGDDVGGG